MANVIILVGLALICVYSVYSYWKKLQHSGGCCGEHDAPEKKVKVCDRDRSHYPYKAIIKIDGMICINCVHGVENALNSLSGVWAKVDLASQQTIVQMKQPTAMEDLRQAVRKAGYTVLSIEL